MAPVFSTKWLRDFTHSMGKYENQSQIKVFFFIRTAPVTVLASIYLEHNYLEDFFDLEKKISTLRKDYILSDS